MPLDTTSRLLGPFLGHLSAEELDTVPYGIIELDPDGVITGYNQAEADDVGHAVRPIGRHFFRDVCPSADVPEFHGLFLNGVERRDLDATLIFRLTCGARPRRLLIRLYYCVRTRSVWLFTARPDGSPLAEVPAELPAILRSESTPADCIEQPRLRLA